MRQRVNWRPVLRRKSWHGLQACLISRLNTSLGLTESGTRTGLHNISALKSVSRFTTTVISRQVRTIFTRSVWKENTLYFFLYLKMLMLRPWSALSSWTSPTLSMKQQPTWRWEDSPPRSSSASIQRSCLYQCVDTSLFSRQNLIF